MSKTDGPNTTAPGADTELLDMLAAELNAVEPDADVCGSRLAELERRLAERNQLVEILTERLEKAADQIDRLQRSGGAIKTDTSAGLTPEFLHEHRDLAPRLETSHNPWEERYEGPSQRRIEASLAELAERFDELCSGSLPESQSPDSSAPGSGVTSFLERVRDDKEQDEQEGLEVRPAPESKTYEHGRTSGHSSAAGPNRIEIVLLNADDGQVPENVPLPAAIDVDQATHGDLHDAVLQRDRYLSWLCHKVRNLASRLEAWLREHPNHFVGMMLRADAELKKKDWPAAEQTLKQLIEIYPEYNGGDNAYEKLAGVYQTTERPQDERAVLERFVQQTADGVPANLRLVELQSNADDWVAVRASAQRLLAVDPLLRNVHEAAATAAEHLDQPDEVATALRRVAQLDPDDPAGVHLRLAQALHSIGRNDEAKRHVLQALEEAPRYREAHRLLLKLVRGPTGSEAGSDSAAASRVEAVSQPAAAGTIEPETKQ